VVRGSCDGFYRTWLGVRAGELQCAAHSCAAVRTSYATEPCPWIMEALCVARGTWVGIIGLGCQRCGLSCGDGDRYVRCDLDGRDGHRGGCTTVVQQYRLPHESMVAGRIKRLMLMAQLIGRAS
jgi:hypothetical protein